MPGFPVHTNAKQISLNERGAKDNLYQIPLRSEVLTEATVYITVFWDVTQCSLIYRYQNFGGTCCCRLQGRSYIRKMEAVYSSEMLFTASVPERGICVPDFLIRKTSTEDDDNRFSRNVNIYLRNYTVAYSRRH
jgi:hypothetical protein